MQKRAGLNFFSLFLVAILFISTFGFASAQEEIISEDNSGGTDDGSSAGGQDVANDAGVNEQGDTNDEIESTPVQGVEEIYSDLGEVEFQGEAGITPDSAFYGVDNFVEGMMVGDDPERALDYKEEKIAEAEQMIEEGNVEGAIDALDRANEHRDVLEKEVSPEIERRARESSLAVKEVFGRLEGQIEGEQWEEVRGMIEESENNEDKVAAAAKISSQIQELCKTLSQIDPLEYSRMCRSEGDSPKWQKSLDKELTAEQKKEAERFFETMSQCFKNPSECRCDDISVPSFAEKCKTITPIAAKCQGGDEGACKLMDNMDSPIDLLPDYLQGVMRDVEMRYGNAKMEINMPPECIDAGITNPSECGKIMFKLHAPAECVQALERGEINPKTESEQRKACDEIMFRKNAPKECIDAGITNPSECGKIMFKQYAPKECIDAGLDGSVRSDETKCRQVVRTCAEGTICVPGSQYAPGTGPNSVSGGVNCRGISDPNERLKCYDGAVNNVQEYAEVRREEMREFVPPMEVERRIEPSQQAQPGEGYIAPFMGGGGNAPMPPEGGEMGPPPGDYGLPREGPGLPPEGGQMPGPGGEGIAPGDNYVAPGDVGSGGSAPSEGGESAPSGDSGGSAPSGDSGGSSGGESAPSGDSGGSSDGGEVTGSVILTGNAFFDYYYN